MFESRVPAQKPEDRAEFRAESRSVVLLLCGALAWTAVAGPVSAQEAAKAPEAVGLRGILAFEVPADLSEDATGDLGPNWAEWSKAFVADVTALYQDEASDVAAQRKQVAALRARLGVIDRALADARYRTIHAPLADLQGALSRRLDLAEAILDTLELDPVAVRKEQSQAARDAALKALAGLEAHLKPIKGSEAWLPWVKAKELKEVLVKDADYGEVVSLSLAQFAKRGTVADAKQKAFLSAKAFTTLEAALQEVAAAAKAGPKKVDVAQLRSQLATLVERIEEYLGEPTQARASAIRTAYDAARASAADDGARLAKAVRTRFINYNLQVVASEDFLSKLFRQQRTETGTVSEFVSGASVYGSQTTTTTTAIDLKPAENGARFDIVLQGVTRSNTSGSTDQATVFSSGYHTFQANKEVSFDGVSFRSKPGTIWVNANNSPYAARTGSSGVPLFGGIAEGIAMSVARQRAAEARGYTAGRIQQRVLPRFDSEVDRSFADVEAALHEDLEKRLAESKVLPDATSYRTSDTHLRFSARLMDKDELGGDRPSPILTPARGLTLHLHETFLNNFFDRMAFAGRTMTNEEVRKEIETFLTKVLGQDVKLTPPKEGYEDDPTKLVFAKSDPVRFRFENDELQLVIRAGLKRDGEADIPAQIVTVPLKYRVQGNQLVVTRGDIKVAPLEKPESLTVQIAQASVIRKKIQSSIKDHSRSAAFQIKRDDKPPVPAVVRQIAAVDGWLSVSIE